MLIIDEARAVARAMWASNELTQQEVSEWVDREERWSKYADDPEENPLDSSKKIGSPMAHTELENRLAKLNPNLRFIWGPAFSHHKMMALQLPNGELQSILVYPTGIIPERSIHRSNVKWVPSPDYVIDSKDFRIEDYEWMPLDHEETVQADTGEIVTINYKDYYKPDGYKDPVYNKFGRWEPKNPENRPGWNRIVEPFGEKLRGWRTVLVRLVKSGILTVGQVESRFLSDNTPQWKHYMGKGPVNRGLIT